MKSDIFLLLMGIAISLLAITSGILSILIPLYTTYAKDETIIYKHPLPPHPFLGILKSFSKRALKILLIEFILVLYFMIIYLSFPYWKNLFAGFFYHFFVDIGVLGLGFCAVLIYTMIRNFSKKVFGGK